MTERHAGERDVATGTATGSARASGTQLALQCLSASADSQVLRSQTTLPVVIDSEDSGRQEWPDSQRRRRGGSLPCHWAVPVVHCDCQWQPESQRPPWGRFTTTVIVLTLCHALEREKFNRASLPGLVVASLCWVSAGQLDRVPVTRAQLEKPVFRPQFTSSTLPEEVDPTDNKRHCSRAEHEPNGAADGGRVSYERRSTGRHTRRLRCVAGENSSGNSCSSSYGAKDEVCSRAARGGKKLISCLSRYQTETSILRSSVRRSTLILTSRRQPLRCRQTHRRLKSSAQQGCAQCPGSRREPRRLASGHWHWQGTRTSH